MQSIAGKVGLSAGLLTAAVVGCIAFLTGISLLFAPAAGLAVGFGVAWAVRRQLADRIARLDTSLSALRDEGGRTDEVTDLAGDEIDRLVRKGDQALFGVRKRMSDLNRAESYRRDYVGDVSHEIKTPIFAIQGFAETLLSGALDDPEVNRGFVQKILHHASRLNALARDLAEISRLETGALKLNRGPFDIGRVFEEVREALEHVVRQKDIQLDIDTDRDARWVDGDRDRLRQVITNLADNAVKYNNTGGKVRLRARREDNLVRVVVEDDGIGIAPEDLPRVTERFYRADKSRSRSQGGTGLGLSIVKHILAAHEAALDIESTPGTGSTFSFVLPAAEGETAMHARTGCSAESDPSI